jgi:hypothetical protein
MSFNLGKLELRIVRVHAFDFLPRRSAQNLQQRKNHIRYSERGLTTAQSKRLQASASSGSLSAQ